MKLKQAKSSIPKDIASTLVSAARAAREAAYAPYSGFMVGAAILAPDGRIFSGANVENASYGATICAERVAAASAVAAGARSFEAIAVVTFDAGPVFPCGLCRQFLSEFGDMAVICACGSGKMIVTRLKELNPHGFDLKGRGRAGIGGKTRGRTVKR